MARSRGLGLAMAEECIEQGWQWQVSPVWREHEQQGVLLEAAKAIGVPEP